MNKKTNNKYADLHRTMNGHEIIGIPTTALTPKVVVEHDEEKDILFHDPTTPLSFFSLPKSAIMIVPSGICHAPLCGKGDVTKIYGESGEALKKFYVRDGMGIKRLSQIGIQTYLPLQAKGASLSLEEASSTCPTKEHICTL